ncbi:hypothetical protein FHL15_010030 [Xylaria flabelliformis]|uniref:DUF6594 domain-containing protein n=1 Tax=Xylaria flabelliformis TaxID=2512241 RepID=A0A553HMD1_9PEZI|nr:hypothetical protein FHL15_010030 [Xylaria flabelliformis]
MNEQRGRVGSLDGSELSGYHRLANIMQQDENFAIFRQFREMNIIQLMSLQAEILDLQAWFQNRRFEDETEHPTYSSSFRELRQSQHEQTPDQSSTRSSITSHPPQEHNALLLQVSQLSQAPKPRKSQLHELQRWLRDEKGGNNFLKVTEFNTWEDPEPNEYIAVKKTATEDDYLTKLVSNILLLIFHRLFGQRWKAGKIIDQRSGLTSYSDTKISRAGNIFAATLSSALPVLSIFVLNNLHSTTLRIAVTLVFTTVFALVLATFSSARRVEIFAATATYVITHTSLNITNL